MSMKVMLVDDHPLFVEGLQYLLKTQGINVVGIATDSKSALEKACKLKPDIILMDVKMPDCSGLDLLKQIKTEMPDIKIVMLTTSDEDDDLFEAVKSGASGYLLKNASAKELVSMLSALEKGEVPLSPGLVGRIFKEFRRDSASYNASLRKPFQYNNQVPLNERQLKVLELVANGMTYKEVGTVLGITERTVKYHMARIIELLHLEKRSQVIAYASKLGLVDNRKPEND
ncbi:Response regulator protein VraR [bioreactor metagenome]|uniref:Response regulator protein VraR n=1 Tax=bioreactor metagenome TaxID=1076179 RepID=A0A645AUW1_9ZZZZ